MKKAKLVVLLTAILCSVSGACASTVYTYTGNPFNNLGGPISAMFRELDVTLTFDEPLPQSSSFMTGTLFPQYSPGPTLLDWKVSSGFFTLGANAVIEGTLLFCILSTDAYGRIDSWLLAAEAPGAWPLTDYTSPGLDQTTILNGSDPLDPLNSYGQILDQPGTWTVEGGLTPEPGSFALVLGALAGGFAWRRKRARA